MFSGGGERKYDRAYYKIVFTNYERNRSSERQHKPTSSTFVITALPKGCGIAMYSRVQRCIPRPYQRRIVVVDGGTGVDDHPVQRPGAI